MGLRYLFILLSLFQYLVTFSQEDSTYIRRFPEKVTIRVGLQNTSNSFTIRNNTNGEAIEFLPNDKTYLGISALFRSIELDLGFAPGFFSENQDNKGSKLFTLNFRMFFGRWMQTLDFYNQKGFFTVDDIGNFIEAFPELGTLKVGGGTSYIFNKNFSFRAIGFQNEWQKKSAGSFIPRFTFYYTRFNVSDGGLPSNQYLYDLAIGPGYYYNWVIKKHFILSAGATVGFGVNYTKSEEGTFNSALFQTLLRVAVGYNSERFFIGINSNAQFLGHGNDKDSVLEDDITFGEFYIGYRFDAPKKWMKKAEKFNKKFGLE